MRVYSLAPIKIKLGNSFGISRSFTSSNVGLLYPKDCVGCVGGGGEGGIKKKRAAWKEGALEGAAREGVMVTVWVCVVRFAITISRVKPGHPHSFFFLLYQLLLL